VDSKHEKRTRLDLRQRAQRRSGLAACSLCLRVLRGGEWVEAGDLIRVLRTFEQRALPRLGPGLCDHCELGLWERRRLGAERLAA
jgi:hypothetical protein